MAGAGTVLHHELGNRFCSLALAKEQVARAEERAALKQALQAATAANSGPSLENLHPW